MQYEGHVAGGVIVLDDKAGLPEGTLPEDMAAKHDHYIHGSPKR